MTMVINMTTDNLSHQTSVCLQHGVCFIDCLLRGVQRLRPTPRSPPGSSGPTKPKASFSKQDKNKASVFDWVRLNQDLTRTAYSSPLLISPPPVGISQLDVGRF